MVVMTCCLYILITKSLFRLASSQTTPFQHLFRQMKKNFAAASRILPLLAILVVPSYFRDDGTELLFALFFPFFFHSSYSVRFACCCCEDNVIFMIINLFSFSHCLAITGADFTMRNLYISFQHLFLIWCSPTCTLHYSNLNSVCVYIILFTWIFSFVFFSFSSLTDKEILFVALNSTSFFCRVTMHYWELESYFLFFLLFVFTIFVKFPNIPPFSLLF